MGDRVDRRALRRILSSASGRGGHLGVYPVRVSSGRQCFTRRNTTLSTPEFGRGRESTQRPLSTVKQSGKRIVIFHADRRLSDDPSCRSPQGSSVSRRRQRPHSRLRRRSCCTRRRRIASTTETTRPFSCPNLRIRHPIPQQFLRHTRDSVPYNQKRARGMASALSRLKSVLKSSVVSTNSVLHVERHPSKSAVVHRLSVPNTATYSCLDVVSAVPRPLANAPEAGLPIDELGDGHHYSSQSRPADRIWLSKPLRCETSR